MNLGYICLSVPRSVSLPLFLSLTSTSVSFRRLALRLSISLLSFLGYLSVPLALYCLSVPLFLCFSFCLPPHLSLSTTLPVSPSLYPSFYSSLHLSIYLSFFLSLCLPLCLFFSLAVNISLSPLVFLSLFLISYLSARLSVLFICT